MISEISALISTVQGLRDINRGLQEIETLDAVREKAVQMNFLIIDLQNAVMTVQMSNQSLSEEKKTWNDSWPRFKIGRKKPNSITWSNWLRVCSYTNGTLSHPT